MKNTSKQFLLSLLATTISIILTFGVAAIIDNYKNNKAKKGLVLTVIYDMDKTLQTARQADSALKIASRAQLDIVKNPDSYDSLKNDIVPALLISSEEFSMITEKIFSSNIETFSTIGNVNFVNYVSSFYQNRSSYKSQVIDVLKEELQKNNILLSYEGLLDVNFSSLYFDNFVWLSSLSEFRDNCVKIMKLTDEEIREFSELREVSDDNNNSYYLVDEMMQEMYEAEDMLKEAREKFKKHKK
ncbi:MAG: hypothetical protein IK103_06695 [Bacteroidales bacterium]|nr:hypothetical protein [Bacteroidales bacterium]